MNHLDGIKVLNTITYHEATGELNWLAVVIATFTMLTILTILPRIMTFPKGQRFIWHGKIEFLMGFLIITCSLCFGLLAGYYMFGPTKEVTKYKICIVDENLSMQEFKNTYKILNEEGEIYTVIFRDEGEIIC